MSYPPEQQPQLPQGQHYGQPVPHGYQQPPQMPVAPYGYAPVHTMVVKERGFNPVTFGVHACLWIFLHWWIAFLTIGLWLVVAIPVTFIGWRVKRTVPVQQMQAPYSPHLPPR